MEIYLENQINLFLWISLISITFFLLEKLAKIFGLWAKARTVPGLPCLSFYGHCHLFSSSNLTDILYKSHKKCGSVVKLWLCPTQLLVSVEDVELIKEVLLKAEDKLPLTGKAFCLAFGSSSFFTSSFDKVEHRRKSLEVEFGGALLERVSLIPGGVLDHMLERTQGVTEKGGLDCETVSQHLAFTILGATLYGDVFLSWPKATVYEKLLMTIARDACFWASYCVTPFWKQEFWRYQDMCTNLKFLTQELIKECKQTYKSDFLWSIGGHEHVGYEPCGEIISLMFHGSSTMSALIGNVLTRLVMHPDIQNEIHSEIIVAKNVLEGPGQWNNDQMPYLLATVYESARLLPAGPLLQRCSLRQDLNLKNGMVIPAGAIIVVPVQLVQTDSLNWGDDAGKFNPCRFLSRTGDSLKSDDKKSLSGLSSHVMKEPNEFEAFFPFGSGARACIGQKLAIRGISSLFASLLKSYEVKLQPGYESNPKLMMCNNSIQQFLPSPKIIFMKRAVE